MAMQKMQKHLQDHIQFRPAAAGSGGQMDGVIGSGSGAGGQAGTQVGAGLASMAIVGWPLVAA